MGRFLINRSAFLVVCVSALLVMAALMYAERSLKAHMSRHVWLHSQPRRTGQVELPKETVDLYVFTQVAIVQAIAVTGLLFVTLLLDAIIALMRRSPAGRGYGLTVCLWCTSVLICIGILVWSIHDRTLGWGPTVAHWFGAADDVQARNNMMPSERYRIERAWEDWVPKYDRFVKRSGAIAVTTLVSILAFALVGGMIPVHVRRELQRRSWLYLGAALGVSVSIATFWIQHLEGPADLITYYGILGVAMGLLTGAPLAIVVWARTEDATEA